MHASLNNLGPPKDIGDEPSFEATFRDEPTPLQVSQNLPGDLVDPDDVIFIYKTPDLVETSFQWTVDDEVTRAALGRFRFAPPPLTQNGRHRVRVKSTGGVIAAEEGYFVVNRSSFTNP